MRLALGALVLLLAAASPAAAATSALDCLRFLVGTWNGDSTGADQGSGFFRFELKMDGRVLLRTNHAEYPAQGGRAASVHDDFMAIESASGGLKATYVDNEGNAILYTVKCGDDGRSAVFLSAAEPGRPQFRLTYRLAASDDAVDGLFEIAPPGGSFNPYKRWTGRRAP